MFAAGPPRQSLSRPFLFDGWFVRIDPARPFGIDALLIEAVSEFPSSIVWCLGVIRKAADRSVFPLAICCVFFCCLVSVSPQFVRFSQQQAALREPPPPLRPRHVCVLAAILVLLAYSQLF